MSTYNFIPVTKAQRGPTTTKGVARIYQSRPDPTKFYVSNPARRQLGNTSHVAIDFDPEHLAIRLRPSESGFSTPPTRTNVVLGIANLARMLPTDKRYEADLEPDGEGNLIGILRERPEES